MKVALARLIIIFCGSILAVVAVFVLSRTAVHERNPFIRQFPPHALLEDTIVDIGYNSYYFAGSMSEELFLGNVTAPSHVLQVNATGFDTCHVTINLSSVSQMQFKRLTLQVDSPFFYIGDGTVPLIMRGRMGVWDSVAPRFGDAFFVNYSVMSPHAVAMRSLSTETNEYELGSQKAYGRVRLAPQLLERQIDGKFCVDGMLHYDKKTGKLVYVYFYRNQFIVADSSLNLVYRGNTIDTVSRATVQLAEISPNLHSQSAPPVLVNRLSCVSDGLLFVNSALLSRNEDIAAFEHSAVIDLYDLNSGHYLFSFYVPHVGGESPHAIFSSGRKLYVLGGRSMAVFDITWEYVQRARSKKKFYM